jgi:methionyl-tRNA formyltransferase
MKKIRIVFFGTPEFAASQLEAILRAGYDVVAVVTAPDKPSGRGQKIHFSEVKEVALKHQLPLLQPEKLKAPDFLSQLQNFQANLFIVVAFRMLPEEVWTMPDLGTFNLHASLLPQYRGAAPINHAVMNGEIETGLTTFFLNREIDKGAIILQEKTLIGTTETAGSLHDRLMLQGNELVIRTIKAIENESAVATEQDMTQNAGTILKEAKKIFKDDCYIKWNLSLHQIFNQIRGLSPYPTAFTQIASKEGKTIDLKVYETEIIAADTNPDERYQLQTDNKTYLRVVLVGGYLSFLKIQQAGKKALPTKEFLLGQKFLGNWHVVQKG